MRSIPEMPDACNECYLQFIPEMPETCNECYLQFMQPWFAADHQVCVMLSMLPWYDPSYTSINVGSFKTPPAIAWPTVEEFEKQAKDAIDMAKQRQRGREASSP